VEGKLVRMHRIALFLAICILTSCDEADTSENDPGMLYEYQVLPQATGESIVTSSEPHYAYLDTRAAARGKLIVFLSGTDSYPQHYQLFSQTAASLGYHVVNLNYLNGEPVSRCFQETDETCFSAFHEEVIFGSPGSDFVNVDSANSIYNRTLRLLVYLDGEHPGQGWSDFFTSGTLNVEKLVVAGHSQGGGHAAYFARVFAIDRLILFASPNDYSEKYDRPAPWCEADFATSPTRFFGLLHRRDEIASASYQYAIWNVIGLLSSADTISADGSDFTSSHALVTNYEPNPNASPRLKHNVPVRDDALPTGSDGEHLISVWKYLLGN
jgi:hypothetical protein